MRPTVRPVEPPASPIPQLAECLGAHGRQLAAAAAAAVYREGPAGWFASEAAAPALRDWLEALRRSCQCGIHAGALRATPGLMQRAHIHAASPLERHAFLERFGQVCTRTLVRTGAEREEIAATRRLFAPCGRACSRPVTEA